MDLKKTILICAVLCLFCCVSPALADSPTHISMNVGTFTPLVQNSEYGVMALPVTDTISQGQTKSYSYFIPTNAERLDVYLEWERDIFDNSLSLIAYDPNYSYGPFQDSYDGDEDGEILIVMSSFRKGCLWDFKVFGEQVIGTQTFSLSVNVV